MKIAGHKFTRARARGGGVLTQKMYTPARTSPRNLPSLAQNLQNPTLSGTLLETPTLCGTGIGQNGTLATLFPWDREGGRRLKEVKIAIVLLWGVNNN